MTQKQVRRALGLDEAERKKRQETFGTLLLVLIASALMGWACYVTGYNKARKDAGLWTPDPAYYCPTCWARRTADPARD